jgi:hypothetical protein
VIAYLVEDYGLRKGLAETVLYELYLKVGGKGEREGGKGGGDGGT